jgi:AcrR family transcriptional regulator
MARIAQRAKVSKSVIVYHFGTKERVFEQVVAEVMKTATEALLPLLDRETSMAGKLRAYITGRVGFLATHRAHMLALFEIWMNLRDDGGDLRMSDADAESTIESIAQLLAAGQRAGEFGTFSTRVMAVAIRQAVDGALLQVRVNPSFDLDEYGRELVALFDRATRRQA